jgi:hypothetical protein
MHQVHMWHTQEMNTTALHVTRAPDPRVAYTGGNTTAPLHVKCALGTRMVNRGMNSATPFPELCVATAMIFSRYGTRGSLG